MMCSRSLLLAAAVFIAAALPSHAQDTAPQTLITNVHVFDGENEARIENANVLIEGNLIQAISTDPIEANGAILVDGGGRTMIPGLIDMHWHVSYCCVPQTILFTGDLSEVAIRSTMGAEDTLMRGFTTVRDAGGNPFAIKRMVDAGEIPGPRIFPSGAPISQTSGHFDFRGVNDVPRNPADPLPYWERNAVLSVADGVPQMIQRVREHLRMGASQIKLATGGGVASSFDPLDVQEFTFDEMQAAVEVAETWNTYVMAHVFSNEAVRTSIRAGIKSIEHGFLVDDETLQLMADNGVWLSLQPLLNDEDALQFPNPESQRKFEVATQGTERVYARAKELGVKIAFGTDLLFDPSAAAKQGKMLVKIGRWFTPYEALRMATSTNAELLGLSGPRHPYQAGPLGVIAEGAYADLILVDGNPLEDLSLVADPDANFDLIMKDGVIHKNEL